MNERGESDGDRSRIHNLLQLPPWTPFAFLKKTTKLRRQENRPRVSCLNNPTNCHDIGGYLCAKDCGPVIANGNNNKSRSIFTSDEETARKNLQEKGFTIYKGTPVVTTSVTDGAATVGVIFMGKELLDDADFGDTLNHERGHSIHFFQVSPTNYLQTTAILSLVGAGLTKLDVIEYDDYYNLPWERIADQFGGVDRGYAKGATTGGWIFWAYTILTPC